MRKQRFTKEQIIGITREQADRMSTADVCRRHRISSATFFKWKAKFGGMDVSDARKLKALEDENAKLKKLLAAAMLDDLMLKDLNSKMYDPPLPLQESSYGHGHCVLCRLRAHGNCITRPQGEL